MLKNIQYQTYQEFLVLFFNCRRLKIPEPEIVDNSDEFESFEVVRVLNKKERGFTSSGSTDFSRYKGVYLKPLLEHPPLK